MVRVYVYTGDGIIFDKNTNLEIYKDNKLVVKKVIKGQGELQLDPGEYIFRIIYGNYTALKTVYLDKSEHTIVFLKTEITPPKKVEKITGVALLTEVLAIIIIAGVLLALLAMLRRWRMR
ncbi:MAG: hypothetical protein J7J99_09050 [Thermoprotei archaeon]|nr:hypothetical protein [Thermoprotei archaeon]